MTRADRRNVLGYRRSNPLQRFALPWVDFSCLARVAFSLLNPGPFTYWMAKKPIRCRDNHFVFVVTARAHRRANQFKKCIAIFETSLVSEHSANVHENIASFA